MRRQEETSYSYTSNYRPETDDPDNRLNVVWREKICHWSYNVVDHFDLSREMVAISMNLFDRYMATLGNKCTGNMALLTSLTTLHLAIKLHDSKKIKISTLANLSRGQFGPAHIEEMERTILSALGWAVHPPTAYSFISHLLLLLPQEVPTDTKKDLYELSRYLSELTVCDSFFVEKNPSTVAFASILNVMEDMSFLGLSSGIREKVSRDLSVKLHLNYRDPAVTEAQERLRAMTSLSTGRTSPTELRKVECLVSVSSPVSVSSTSSGASFFRGGHSRKNSFDSMGSCRRRCAVSPMTSSRHHRSTSIDIVSVH
jgi:lipoyl(octanoyl) transferase